MNIITAGIHSGDRQPGLCDPPPCLAVWTLMCFDLYKRATLFIIDLVSIYRYFSLKKTKQSYLLDMGGGIGPDVAPQAHLVSNPKYHFYKASLVPSPAKLHPC